MHIWEEYYKRHSKRKPREQLVRAISYCHKKNEALDLGSGNLIESKFLVENGFKNVVAIDSSAETMDFLSSSLKKKIILLIVPFKQYKFPLNTFDLVNAQYSLPFYGKEDFDTFFNSIKSSLRKNGVFVGQFFGISDGWNTIESDLIFHTREDIILLFKDFEIIEFFEEEKDGTTAKGDSKHWHVFHVIAQYKE
jgi:tellurite methyltransferase